MKFVKKLQESIEKHADHPVLCISNTFYSYKDFAVEISKIRSEISKITHDSDSLIGLVTNDDIQTYASIIALWLEGKAYVPVNPDTPIDRNIKVFQLTETQYVLDSSEKSSYTDYNVIASSMISEVPLNLEPKKISGDQLAYILFTSGTTGLPKGVPITFDNVAALVDAIDAEPTFTLDASDRCLQMFELTFDLHQTYDIVVLEVEHCIVILPKNGAIVCQTVRYSIIMVQQSLPCIVGFIHIIKKLIPRVIMELSL